MMLIPIRTTPLRDPSPAVISSVSGYLENLSHTIGGLTFESLCRAISVEMRAAVLSPPSHYNNTLRMTGPGELIEKNFPGLAVEEREKVAELLLSEIRIADSEGRYLSRRPDMLKKLAIIQLDQIAFISDTDVSNKMVDVLLGFFARHGFAINEAVPGYGKTDPKRGQNIAAHVFPSVNVMEYFRPSIRPATS